MRTEVALLAAAVTAVVAAPVAAAEAPVSIRFAAPPAGAPFTAASSVVSG